MIQGEYDLVVLASSWDRRSICLAKAGEIHAAQGILFLFSKRDDLGLRDNHDQILCDFMKDNFAEHKTFLGESSDFRDLWAEFEKHIIDNCSRLGRPLRILVDLSTIPRYFSVGLLARSMRIGLAEHVSFFYAEGTYPDESNDEEKHDLFTAGGWDAVAIPGLEGDWDPEKHGRGSSYQK